MRAAPQTGNVLLGTAVIVRVCVEHSEEVDGGAVGITLRNEARLQGASVWRRCVCH